VKKNVLFLDIDGTLYDYKNNQIPPSAKLSLEKIHSTTEIVIATGRAKYMLHSIEEIKHLIDYYVLINGQYIVSQNEVIYQNPLNKQIIHQVVQYLSEYNLPYGFQGADEETISQINDSIVATFKRIGLYLPREDKDFYQHNDVFQMWCLAKYNEITPLIDKFPTLDFIRWLDVGFDILNKGTSKGEGMVKLIEILSWQNKNIYAIGDGDNDYEMIKLADVGIAMGNATAKLKEVANYVTTNIDEDGLYNALKYLKLL